MDVDVFELLLVRATVCRALAACKGGVHGETDRSIGLEIFGLELDVDQGRHLWRQPGEGRSGEDIVFVPDAAVDRRIAEFRALCDPGNFVDVVDPALVVEGQRRWSNEREICGRISCIGDPETNGEAALGPVGPDEEDLGGQAVALNCWQWRGEDCAIAADAVRRRARASAVLMVNIFM